MEAEIERLEAERDELLRLHENHPLTFEQQGEYLRILLELERLDHDLTGGARHNYITRREWWG